MNYTDSRCFVDTNIFLYSLDEDSPKKQKRAWEFIEILWRSGNGLLSFQVLFEVQAALLNKFADKIDGVKRKEIAEDLSTWPTYSPTRKSFLKAIDLQQQHMLSWWDSLIVVSAIEGKATYLLTEDLNSGQCFQTVTVINPFLI